jgi:hypothetical protein
MAAISTVAPIFPLTLDDVECGFLKRRRSGTRPERHLPQPRVSLRFALPQTHYGVQQGAAFSRIARHALTEDLVATKRTRKRDAMAGPEEIQRTPVSLVDGGVDHVEGDEPEPAWHLPDTDVMELVAAAHGSSDPDNRAVLRDAFQRPRRSVKLSAIPLTCGQRTLCARALALSLLHP